LLPRRGVFTNCLQTVYKLFTNCLQTVYGCCTLARRCAPQAILVSLSLCGLLFAVKEWREPGSTQPTVETEEEAVAAAAAEEESAA
jgi:hypothetical protein